MKASALFAVLTLVPGIFLLQTTGGAAAVAVIDFERAVADTQEGKDAITKLTEFANERRSAIATKVKEADELENRLRVQSSALNDAARTQLTRELQTAQGTIESMQQDAQTKISEMEQQLLVPVQRKTATEVSAYARERGLKIVFDASALRDGLVYVHDTTDITTEIIRRIASDMRNSDPKDAFALPDRDPLKRLERQIRKTDWLTPTTLTQAE